MELLQPVRRSKKEVFNDYDGFVEKFKPKKTTDDCYTPAPVYDALVGYINDHVLKLDGYNIVRPFWPSKEYRAYDYRPNDIVIDNPPFSILSKILDFYIVNGIKFWLFAPHLTLFQYSKRDCTLVCVNVSVTYENGAVINTDFVTNLLPKDMWVHVDGKLHCVLKEANKLAFPTKKRKKYIYPINVTTSAELGNYIASAGKNFTIYRGEGEVISKLDCQKGSKAIFGSGILLSEAKAKAKAKAEAKAKAKAEAKAKAKAEIKAEILSLSEREKKIISQLA